jgi:hypothetical protein
MQWVGMVAGLHAACESMLIFWKIASVVCEARDNGWAMLTCECSVPVLTQKMRDAWEAVSLSSQPRQDVTQSSLGMDTVRFTSLYHLCSS